MKQIWLISKSEWAYWLRSRVALSSALIFLLLIIVTSLVTAVRMESEMHKRMHHQSEAEQTFLSQPDRHPHRMVHYGHYLFRTPAPLSIFDPGLDTVTGQSIFLEGHRQNTVMFAESSASADTGSLSLLSPAMIYQLFAPLLIILLGHSAISRERENGVLISLLSQGITGLQLVLGKALALFIFIQLLLLPLLISCLFAVLAGESFGALASVYVVYFIYLSVWGGLTLLISAMIKKGTSVNAVLAGLWFSLCFVIPSLAVNIAIEKAPMKGKIEADFAMLADIRKLGDGHNANDPAFQKLRADMLKKYKVERVEDLPINYRGLVAIEGEKKLTDVLNKHAEIRMSTEATQEQAISSFAWFSPALAISVVSRTLAGTDLTHYHRFQREAEQVRYAFVQGLNRAHVEQVSYQDDINRNKDEASWQKARVDASNWGVLDTYQFQPDTISSRINNSFSLVVVLCSWLLMIGIFSYWSARNLRP
jgi:ABC-2 type transport system permease protein